MNLDDFDLFSQSNGFKCIKNKCYGKIGEFNVVGIFKKTSFISSINFVFSLETEVEKQTIKEIKNELKKKYAYLFDHNFITIVFNAKGNNVEQHFKEFSSKVTEVFKAQGLRPASTCPICQLGSCDSVAHIGKGFRPVHRKCITEQISDAKDTAESNLDNGSYITGIIGGILGGLLAIIPSILSIWFAETIYGILYALIPLGIYYGYKLFNGKLNKLSLFIVCILSLFNAFLIEFIVLYLSIMQLFGTAISVIEVLSLFTEADILSEFVIESMQSIIFIALGLWIAWGNISRNSHTQIQEADSVLDTVVNNY